MFRYIVLIAVLVVASGHVRAADPDSIAVAADSQTEIDRLVHDVCGREVVLLGEDNYHGSGRTTEIESLLVRRLVSECGFNQILFESQFFEFPPLERAMADGHATQAQLADAVGGVWSRTEQVQSLLGWLFDAGVSGKVRIGGIDPRAGSATGRFAMHELGGLLAARLPRKHRTVCKQVLDRNHAWAYDESHPFDGTEKSRLEACADLLRKATKQDVGKDESEMMALAYSRYALDDAGPDARDRGMYEVLAWYRARGRYKTIVWTATVHAAKRPDVDRVPMGYYLHEQLGDRMAAIGFTAVAGSSGGAIQKQVQALPELQEDMLEARFRSLPPDGLRYLSRSGLASMGSLSSRALSYAKPKSLDWSELLDGMIVLGEERPAIQLTK